MTVDVTREEFEARVGVLEREVEGEKVVTRYILEQTRNGDDLAAVKSRLDRGRGAPGPCGDAPGPRGAKGGCVGKRA